MLSTLNTLALMRITPLLTSSASLFYCADQHVLFSSFISPDNAIGPRALPSFWSIYLNPALGFIFGLYSTSIVSGFVNAYGVNALRVPPAKAGRLYTLGAAFSVAHFLFVPVVAAHIEAIVNDGTGKETPRRMRRWLRIHAVRSALVDFPAWLFFLVAVGKAVVAV